MTEALRQSYEIRLAKIDVRVAKNDVKHSRVDYFPKMQSQFNSEYLKGLTNSNQPVVVVASTAIPDISRFQSSLSFVTNYTLYDFGIRRRNLIGARKHVEAAGLQCMQQARDVKIAVIDLYAQALQNYKSIQAKQKSLGIQQHLFVMKQRLFEVGAISKVEAAEQAILVAKTLDEISEFKQSYMQNLKDISQLTHLSYDPDETRLKDFEQPVYTPAPFVATDSPEFKFYNLEIQKKQLELQALSRQRLPQIGLYSYYLFYGSSPSKPFQAIGGFGQRSVSGGISMTMPIFDGFKNAADRERKRLEIARLQVERDKKIWELQARHSKLNADAAMYKVQLSTKGVILLNGGDKLGLHQRLSDNKVSDERDLLKEQVDLVDHQLHLDKANIQRIATLLKLKVLTES